MRQSVLIILLLFFSSALFGQDTTQVKISNDSLVVLQKLTSKWLKDFKHCGVKLDGDTIKKTSEFRKLRKDPAYRKIIYGSYNWTNAVDYIKTHETKKYLWNLINMYSSTEKNREFVMKSLVSLNETENVKKLLYETFFTYCFTDPTISTMKRKRPVITHPEVLMKKLSDVKEMRLKIR